MRAPAERSPAWSRGRVDSVRCHPAPPCCPQPSTRRTPWTRAQSSACRDELRDDDIGLKLNSIRRLGTIALALGEERSRTELVPYLADSKQDDDEVLVALAEEIGKLVPHVGGPAHAHCLISLLEELAKTEETVVRDEAVNSMNKIGEDLSEQQIADTFIPALKVRPCPTLLSTMATPTSCTHTAYPAPQSHECISLPSS